ncbi:SCP2 sterol-binding domain-containing protein [Streptomyces sp. 4N509B]|uniref:SCP2 sterol-binding domain-containing protein n=1 Tax=Streptomyces sp. 4N509B TaxID=3457413 RepID=UPI003FD1C534
MADTTPPGGIEDLDFASVTPAEFAALVKKLSNKEITELMRGELRARVLTEIFGRMERLFRPDAAGSLKAVIRWEVTGTDEDPTAVWESAIADGACTVTEGASDVEPRTTLTLSGPDFLKLVSGNASPVMMFMTRKVRIGGDIGLASALTRLFDIPKA